MSGDEGMPIEIAFREPMSDAEVYAVADALNRIALAFEAQHYAQLHRYSVDRKAEFHEDEAARQLGLPLPMQQ